MIDLATYVRDTALRARESARALAVATGATKIADPARAPHGRNRVTDTRLVFEYFDEPDFTVSHCIEAVVPPATESAKVS